MLALSLTFHNTLHLGANLTYWVFYHFEFPFIERYKSNDQPWPWYDDPERWQKLVRKSIAVNIFNANLLPVAVYLILDRLQLSEPHSMAIEELPDTATLVMNILFFIFFEDFIFYWIHRLLHWRIIYPYIHKMHH